MVFRSTCNVTRREIAPAVVCTTFQCMSLNFSRNIVPRRFLKDLCGVTCAAHHMSEAAFFFFTLYLLTLIFRPYPRPHSGGHPRHGSRPHTSTLPRTKNGPHPGTHPSAQDQLQSTAIRVLSGRKCDRVSPHNYHPHFVRMAAPPCLSHRAAAPPGSCKQKGAAACRSSKSTTPPR
jgi:hypothetical protein